MRVRMCLNEAMLRMQSYREKSAFSVSERERVFSNEKIPLFYSVLLEFSLCLVMQRCILILSMVLSLYISLFL